VSNPVAYKNFQETYEVYSDMKANSPSQKAVSFNSSTPMGMVFSNISNYPTASQHFISMESRKKNEIRNLCTC
jgi:hypothetical protein